MNELREVANRLLTPQTTLEHANRLSTLEDLSEEEQNTIARWAELTSAQSLRGTWATEALQLLKSEDDHEVQEAAFASLQTQILGSSIPATHRLIVFEEITTGQRKRVAKNGKFSSVGALRRKLSELVECQEEEQADTCTKDKLREIAPCLLTPKTPLEHAKRLSTFEGLSKEEQNTLARWANHTTVQSLRGTWTNESLQLLKNNDDRDVEEAAFESLQTQILGCSIPATHRLIVLQEVTTKQRRQVAKNGKFSSVTALRSELADLVAWQQDEGTPDEVERADALSLWEVARTWNVYSVDERKVEATRYGFSQVAAFEEYMTLQVAMNDSSKEKASSNPTETATAVAISAETEDKQNDLTTTQQREPPSNTTQRAAKRVERRQDEKKGRKKRVEASSTMRAVHVHDRGTTSPKRRKEAATSVLESMFG